MRDIDLRDISGDCQSGENRLLPMLKRGDRIYRVDIYAGRSFFKDQERPKDLFLAFRSNHVKRSGFEFLGILTGITADRSDRYTNFRLHCTPELPYRYDLTSHIRRHLLDKQEQFLELCPPTLDFLINALDIKGIKNDNHTISET